LIKLHFVGLRGFEVGRLVLGVGCREGRDVEILRSSVVDSTSSEIVGQAPLNFYHCRETTMVISGSRFNPNHVDFNP